MGILAWTAWGLFRLWPLILVAIGIDLLVGRRSTWGAILAGVLIAVLLGGGLWLASTGYQAPWRDSHRNGPTAAPRRLPGANRPTAGCRRRYIFALDEVSPNLITGNVGGAAAGRCSQPVQCKRRRGDLPDGNSRLGGVRPHHGHGSHLGPDAQPGRPYQPRTSNRAWAKCRLISARLT